MELFDELNNVSNVFLLETCNLPIFLCSMCIFGFEPRVRPQSHSIQISSDTRYGVGLDAYVSSTSPKDETWILL